MAIDRSVAARLDVALISCQVEGSRALPSYILPIMVFKPAVRIDSLTTFGDASAEHSGRTLR